MSIKLGRKKTYSKIYEGVYTTTCFKNSIEVTSFLTTIDKSDWGGSGSFCLFSDLDFSKRTDFSNILQRNVNQNRVKTEITQYLDTRDARLKYFPPIIAVLLPYEDGRFSYFQDTYNEVEDFPYIDGISWGENSDSDWKSFTSDDLSNGCLCHFRWVMDRFKAVIIDGQHRISALRQLDDDIRIPVNLIVFNHSKNVNLPALTRSLFIDINNTPVKVSSLKLILMDDKNIHRVLTRRCIKEPFYNNYMNNGAVWNPLGSNLEYIESSNGIQSILIDFQDTGEMNVQEILLSQFTGGFSAITNLTLLNKFIKDYFFKLDSKQGMDNIIKYYNDTQYNKINSRINSCTGDIEDLYEELRNETTDNLIKNYIDFKRANSISNEYITDKDVSIVTNIDLLITYENTITNKIVEKLIESIVKPIIELFLNLKSTKFILDTLRNCHSRLQKSEIEHAQEIAFSLFEHFSHTRETSTFMDNHTQLLEPNHEIVEKEIKEVYQQFNAELLLDDKKQLLLTSVGQRMVFCLFFPDTLSKLQTCFSKAIISKSVLKSPEDIDNKFISKKISMLLNCMLEKKLLQRDSSITFYKKDYLFGKIKTIYIWSSILIKIERDSNIEYKMRPSEAFAKLGSYMLLFVLHLKEKFSISDLLKKQEIKNLQKAFSKNVLELISLEDVIKYLIKVLSVKSKPRWFSIEYDKVLNDLKRNKNKSSILLDDYTKRVAAFHHLVGAYVLFSIEQHLSAILDSCAGKNPPSDSVD